MDQSGGDKPLPASIIDSELKFDKKTVRIDPGPPETMQTPQNGATPLLNESAIPPIRPYMNQKSSVVSQCGLSLYEDDTSTMPTIAAYLRSFTIPGPEEKEQSDREMVVKPKKVAKLGALLGVYLPTIQHILGVQMFLRLLWIVGIGGIGESFLMVFICCLCTLLTCISISAIATNGVIESGGAYFMISRNLGPEFGTAIGILYYLANAVAVSMYLVGGVEILLMYIAPDLPQFGEKDHHDESAMFNNFRLYASGLLIIEIIIVALGVRFVQCFAPISLACVLISIVAVYVGAFVASPSTSPMICMLGEKLLKPSVFTDNGTAYCNKDLGGPLHMSYCNGTNDVLCDEFNSKAVSYVPGIPGFSSKMFTDNAYPVYLETGESAPKQKGDASKEVVQDISTSFFIIMAIFFPSVTGIFTGANMSGDLRDPQKSLPVGTIAAQLTTSFVYLSFVIVFGGTTHGALLRDKYGDSLSRSMIVSRLAWPNEWVLLIGSFTSTFGAALQCLCSAPRLLQSIARDDVIPFLRTFSVVTRWNEPFRALIFTSFIAEIGILIGSIDHVAPVVDFFFLMCYCFVNIVCVLQTLLNSPNWRPRFRFYHWILSLIGALLCLFIMFATYWYFAVVVILLCASIYKYVEYKGAKKEWGDGIRGLALSTAQYSLLRIEDRKHQHPKNWRPQLLVLVKVCEREDEMNQKLLQLAGQLKAGQGLTIVATLIEGDLSQQEDRERAEAVDDKLQAALKDAKVKGFTKVIIGQHLGESVANVIQSIGIGGLRPNTVIVSWPYNWKSSPQRGNDEYNTFLDAIHRAATADMCLLVPKGLQNFPAADARLVGTIDVWWIIHDGGLLILLPFLLKQHKVWRQCKLRVFAVAQLNDNSVKMKQDLQQWVYQLRIEASVDVVELADSTISAYTYERTLLMEERNKLAKDILHLSRQDIEHEPQLLIDRHRSRVGLSSLTGDTLDKKMSTVKTPVERQNSNGEVRRTSTVKTKKISVSLSNPKHSLAPLASTSSPIDSAMQTGGKKSSSVFKAEAGGSPPPSVDPSLYPRKKVFFTRTMCEDEVGGSGSFPDEHLATHKDNLSDGSGSVENLTDLIHAQFTFSAKDFEEEFRRRKSEEDTLETSGLNKTTEVPHLMVDDADASKFAGLDRSKVRKMHTAVKLNRAIIDKSSDSQLVVLNLPRPPRAKQGLANYMDYLEVLTDKLDRVLLVRGSGKEVITIYS